MRSFLVQRLFRFECFSWLLVKFDFLLSVKWLVEKAGCFVPLKRLAGKIVSSCVTWDIKLSPCAHVPVSKVLRDVIRCGTWSCWAGGDDAAPHDGRLRCVMSSTSRLAVCSTDVVCRHIHSVMAKHSGTGLVFCSHLMMMMIRKVMFARSYS